MKGALTQCLSLKVFQRAAIVPGLQLCDYKLQCLISSFGSCRSTALGVTCAALFCRDRVTPLLCAAFGKIPENHLEKEPLLLDTVPLGNALDSL